MSKSNVPGPYMRWLHCASVTDDVLGDRQVARHFLELSHRTHPGNAALYLDEEDEAPCTWIEAWAAYQTLATSALRQRYRELGHDAAIAEYPADVPSVELDWRAVALHVVQEVVPEILDGAWDGASGAGLASEIVLGQRCDLIAPLLRHLPDRIDPYGLETRPEDMFSHRLVGRGADLGIWDAQIILSALLAECGYSPGQEEAGGELSALVGARIKVVFRRKPAKDGGRDVAASIRPMSAKDREDYRLSQRERLLLGWTEPPDLLIEIAMGPWLAMHGHCDAWGRRYYWPTRLLHHELLHARSPAKAGGAWRTRPESEHAFGAEVQRFGAWSFAQAERVRAAYHHPETQRLLRLATEEHDFRQRGGEHVIPPQATQPVATEIYRRGMPPELEEVLTIIEVVEGDEAATEEGLSYAQSVGEQVQQLRARLQDGEAWTDGMSRACAGWRGGLKQWIGGNRAGRSQ